jgi:DNA-binding transcriptional MerR regulator
MALLGIGEFARLAGLSRKALRLYDDLGLLRPARVDPDTGYRWYSTTQLDQARLVASLRRIGVQLTRIREVLALDAAPAAEEIRAHWAAAEVEHAARRHLVNQLVNHPDGAGCEVAVRDLPDRSLLTRIRRVRQDEVVPVGRELFVDRLRRGGVPRAGAPFLVYHGEVSEDVDGPVEWCWPLPDDRAAEIAAGFPDLTLRVEPAHQEACVRPDAAGLDDKTRGEIAVGALAAWTAERDRMPSGGVRLILVPNPGNGKPGPDVEFAVALR